MKIGQTLRLFLMMDITDFRFEDGDADYVDEICFFHIFLQNLHCTFLPDDLALLFLLKEFKPSPGHKMIKLLTFDTCFCCYHNSLNP